MEQPYVQKGSQMQQSRYVSQDQGHQDMMYQSSNYVNWQKQQMHYRQSMTKEYNLAPNPTQQVGQFGNYQKMRQSVALVQGQRFGTGQAQKVKDDLDELKNKLLNMELTEDTEENQRMYQSIQEAKQQALLEIEEYFDDLLFVSMKHQPGQLLRDAMVQSVEKKNAQVDKASVQSLASIVSFTQETKCKAEEIKQKKGSSEVGAQLVLNQDVLQKMKILLPEFAYLAGPEHQDGKLRIETNDYFQMEGMMEKVLVVLNDGYQTLTLYNPNLNQQRAMKIMNRVQEIPYQHSLVITPETSNIFFCGGMVVSNGEITNKMFQFDVGKIQLETKAPMLVRKIGHSLCYLDGFIYVIGGKTNDKVCTKLCEKYDVANDTWSSIAQMAYGRSRAGVTTFVDSKGEKSIYAFFGSDSLQIVNNTIEQYVVADDKWVHVNIKFPFKRLETSGLGCVQINSEQIVVFGGFYEERTSGESQPIFSNKVGVFDVGSSTVRMSAIELPVDYNNTNSCQAIVHNNTVYSVGHFMQQKTPSLVRCLDTDYVLAITPEKSQIIQVLDEVDVYDK